MNEKFSIEIDSAACVGHGRCFDLHPQMFAADDEGFPLLAADAFPADHRAAAQEAVHECPERAISLRPSS